MDHSTLRKTVVLLFAAAVSAVTAQGQSMSSDSMRMSSSTSTAKVFGGRGQYNTFSIGLNAGATSPFLATGGTNDFSNYNVKLGYGISLREQLAHSFGLQLDVHGGKLAGNNNDMGTSGAFNRRSFDTRFWSGTLSGVVNVATIDYIRRKNAVNFFISAGAGLTTYNPSIVYGNGNRYTFMEANGDKHWVKEFIIPIGVGVKFRLTDGMALNLGYTENFLDGDNLDGTPAKPYTKDHFSYGYGGLEFTLGSKSKQNLDWVNPVAMMYDELYDAELRREVGALRGRVGNIESAVNDLKKDSDGDGVSDQFDKCPNTPAGTVVDGAGCEIKFPQIDTSMFVRKGLAGASNAYSNIQFDFDSSVLRTSSYPILDATSTDLRSGSQSVTLNGYASSEGTAAHNMRLSKDRANSVKTYLVNSGVDAKRVKVRGLGETHPIADNSTEDGRVMNRRVEIKR
jgi:OOP family OmpA-OmpF porin